MRRTRLNPVSPDRERKRENTGARGPVCDWIRKRERCAICGTFQTDPAHLDRVGKGHGDWRRDDVMGWWVCRVAPLCRGHHDDLDLARLPAALDLKVRESALEAGRRWAVEVGVDLDDRTHPYEQWRRMGSPDPSDLDF